MLMLKPTIESPVPALIVVQSWCPELVKTIEDWMEVFCMNVPLDSLRWLEKHLQPFSGEDFYLETCA